MNEPKPVQGLPFCAVGGLVRRGAMCSRVGASSDEQGRRRCHHSGECEHKQPPQEAVLSALQPAFNAWVDRHATKGQQHATHLFKREAQAMNTTTTEVKVMAQQPKALRLASLLENTGLRRVDLDSAAAELLRLHAVEMEAHKAIIRASNDEAMRARENAALRAQVERLQAERGQVVAYATEDGRVAMRKTVEGAMPRAARESFTIPLYTSPPAVAQAAPAAPKLDTDTLRPLVARLALEIDPEADLETWPEALAFQIEMARSVIRAAHPQPPQPQEDAA